MIGFTAQAKNPKRVAISTAVRACIATLDPKTQILGFEGDARTSRTEETRHKVCKGGLFTQQSFSTVHQKAHQMHGSREGRIRSCGRVRREGQQRVLNSRDRWGRGEGDWGRWEEFHSGHVFRLGGGRVAVTHLFSQGRPPWGRPEAPGQSVWRIRTEVSGNSDTCAASYTTSFTFRVACSSLCFLGFRTQSRQLHFPMIHWLSHGVAQIMLPQERGVARREPQERTVRTADHSVATNASTSFGAQRQSGPSVPVHGGLPGEVPSAIGARAHLTP